MKHTYRIHVQPHAYRGPLHNARPLTEESLANAIEDAAVRELIRGNVGDYVVDLQLQRPSHEQALNEILIVLQQLGYSWLEATVTEWTDNAVAGFVLGGLGGGTAGSCSGDGAIGPMLTLFGVIIGTVVGSFIESKKVVYEARWNGLGLQLVQVHPAPAPAVGLQPRMA